MKKLSLPVLLFLVWNLLSSVHMVIPTSAEDLGNKIFEAIKQDNFEMIKGLIVTTDDIIQTINHSDMDEEKKESFKIGLVGKIETDSEKTLQQIEDGFKDIREVFVSKKCKKGVAMGKITSRTSPIKGFQIGDLEIEFICKEDVETINVEIIKTKSGWFILEKLRLVGG